MDETVTISLPLSQLNILLSGASELPFKQSAGVIGEVHRQVAAQLEAKKATQAAPVGEVLPG